MVAYGTCRLKNLDWNDEQLAEWIARFYQKEPAIYLRLDNNRFTNNSITNIGNSSLHRIIGLSLSNNPIGDEGARELGVNKKFSYLQRLRIPNTRITAAGVSYLLSKDSMVRELHLLDLSENPIGDKGIEIIANSPVTSAIDDLRLTRTGMTDRGAEALAASPHLKNIKLLCLGNNNLGQIGMEALKNSKNFAKNSINMNG